MGRSKRKGQKRGATLAQTDGSDIESSRHAPDPNSDDFYHDEVDQFHADKNKILLDQGASLDPGITVSDQEEILSVASDSSEDEREIAAYEKQLHRFKSQGFKDDLASDIEDEKMDDLPNEKAWGKSDFYGTDVHDDNLGYLSGSDGEVDAVLEEQEALSIQKRLIEQLDQQDLDLDLFQPAKKSSGSSEKEKITKDLSKLSRKEKLKLLKKESPELLGIIEEYKTKLTELRDRLIPIFTLIKDGGLPASKGTEFITTKVTLLLNYCVNLNFYLTLKAKRVPVTDHPVVSRIVQFRNLITQLDSADKHYQVEMDYILTQLSRGKQVEMHSNKPVRKTRVVVDRSMKNRSVVKQPVKAEKHKLPESVSDASSSDEEEKSPETLDKGGRTWGRKRRVVESQYETRDEKQALEYYAMLKAGKKPADILNLPHNEDEVGEDDLGDDDADDADDDEHDDDMRRGINYQIAKNKGLTPKRKKENRNPRVKNRLKYQKAKKRRKGQIRETRKELKPYAGEISGIRAGVKKSVKFKS